MVSNFDKIFKNKNNQYGYIRLSSKKQFKNYSFIQQKIELLKLGIPKNNNSHLVFKTKLNIETWDKSNGIKVVYGANVS